MATLPSHSSQLQHQDRQIQRQQQQHPQHLSPQNPRHSPHHLYQSGSSPDFDGTSPIARDQLHQRSGSENPGGGGRGRTRQEEDDDDDDDDGTNPEWGLTKAGKKRQRLPLACQVCRKKKIRCSGEQPICKHCLRFSLPCVYKTTTSRRPRNSVRKDSTASGGDRRRNSLTKSTEDRSATPSPPPQASTSHSRPQTIQPISTPSNPLASPNLFFDPFERQDVSVPPSFVHPSTVAVRPGGSLRSITGPSSTTLSVPSDIFGQPGRTANTKAFDVASHLPTRLPPVREVQSNNPPTPPPLNIPSPTASVRSSKVEPHTPLPPRSVLLKLVEIYFTHVNNQTYGFLHRPTFLRHIEEGKVPDGLLYSICAISARFSPTHAPPPLPRQTAKETPAYHAGEPYAIEARKLALREFDKPTVQNVQTLLLLALHDFGGKKGQKAWMFAGMAIRMASALRLNREVDGDAIGADNVTGGGEPQLGYGGVEARATSREKVSWTEREVRRRTFWACFIMDRLNSTGMERPHVIQETDCHVQLPTAERSFMFGIPIKTERLIPPTSSSDAASLHPHTHSMGSEAYLVRIVALWGRVTKYVNQGGRLYDVSPPWTAGSGFAKLSSELQEWVDALPYWLKYSSSNLADQVAISQAPSFVFMHVAYHTIVCTLHRFSVPSTNMATEPQLEEPGLPSWDPPPDFLQTSVKTCFEHAKSISTIMAEVISRSDCIVTAPFLGFAMFTANLFHLHQAFTPCPYVDESPEDAREYFATGVTVLNELRIWWGPLEMLYKAIRVLWQAKARNSQIQIMNEQAPPKAATPAPPQFEGGLQSWFTGMTPGPTGSTPRPFWMTSQPNSPGRGEHFDTTGLIPLPGGNFGLDFVDPNLYANMNGDSFGDMIFDSSQLDMLTDGQYQWWGDISPAIFGTSFDTGLTSVLGDNGKSPAPPPVTPGRPLSPFSNALHGFGRSLGTHVRNGASKSPVLMKKEADNHKSILEQINKDENSVMPPPNLTPRGVTGSTPGTAQGVSVSPGSATGSGQAGTPGWVSSAGHLRNTSAKSPDDDDDDDDKNDDGSEEEEAADLLVYFHARSGADGSSAVDDSIEVPGDDPRPTRAMSGSSASSSPALAVRKRKRQEDEDFQQLTSVAQSGNQGGIGSGNIFPGKSDGTGTAKEVGKGLYLDQAPPTGSVDLLNLLRQPGGQKG